jgi:Type II secretion system (T2SS), protein J
MQQLQTLTPGIGALLGDALKVNDRDRDEVTWLCSAGPGVLTRYANGDFRVSLRVRAGGSKNNQLELGILRKPKDDPGVSNEHETWVRLIDNVNSLQIRYFDSRLNTWVQRWVDTVTLPRLVKIVIGRSDSAALTEIIVPLARTPL